MNDNSLSRSKPGSVIAFDGTQEHLSEPFTGKRYSIIAFLHSTTQDLDVKSLKFLERSGFVLPEHCHSSNKAAPGIEHELSDVMHAVPVSPAPQPVTDRTLIEFCCSEYSLLGATG